LFSLFCASTEKRRSEVYKDLNIIANATQTHSFTSTMEVRAMDIEIQSHVLSFYQTLPCIDPRAPLHNILAVRRLTNSKPAQYHFYLHLFTRPGSPISYHSRSLHRTTRDSMTPQPIDPLRMRIFSELNINLGHHGVEKELMHGVASTYSPPTPITPFSPTALLSPLSTHLHFRTSSSSSPLDHHSFPPYLPTCFRLRPISDILCINRTLRLPSPLLRRHRYRPHAC
jgi:hypothetical protein